MGRRTSSQTMKLALEAGYRGFDSAQVYQNEREVGTAINNFIASSKGRLSRGDFFFTTKLGTNSPDWDTARLSVTISLEVCTLGYIDLFLLHSPYGGTKARLASWEALEDAVIDGEIHSIGVCNYGVDHVSIILLAARPNESEGKLNQVADRGVDGCRPAYHAGS